MHVPVPPSQARIFTYWPSLGEPKIAPPLCSKPPQSDGSGLRTRKLSAGAVFDANAAADRKFACSSAVVSAMIDWSSEVGVIARSLPGVYTRSAAVPGVVGADALPSAMPWHAL